MRETKVAQIINFPKFVDKNGSLVVYECGKEISFDIKRVFSVSAAKDDIRGNHAHKYCTQLLICLSGKISVACDNGFDLSTFTLDNGSSGLLIPAGIWSKQQYLVDNSILMVFCDRLYEKEDYIHNYEHFRSYVGV